jgi:hypothetical protein
MVKELITVAFNLGENAKFDFELITNVWME